MIIFRKLINKKIINIYNTKIIKSYNYINKYGEMYNKKMNNNYTYINKYGEIYNKKINNIYIKK